jgi:anti-sigma B factor antagonist/stage II sporulation protein AA (anti-sigma F factor antagonist)
MELLRIELVDSATPVLSIEGEIDIATVGQLRAALEAALSEHQQIIVDMAGVTFIDAAGIRVLLEVGESRNGSGPLTLVEAPRVAWLLKLVGLDNVTSIKFGDGERLHG